MSERVRVVHETAKRLREAGIFHRIADQEPVEGGVIRSANITPDDETGLGGWTRERFLARFRAAREAAEADGPKPAGASPTVMPWPSYAGMSDAELGAIYDHLRTVKAIRHRVVTYETVPAEEEKGARVD